MKKLLKILPLSFALLVAACGTNNTPSLTPSQEESSIINLFGFQLKKSDAQIEGVGYDLASQIEFFDGKTINDIAFESSNLSVATVNEAGQIVRVNYGSAQIAVMRKDYPLLRDYFTITFLPQFDEYKGKYESQLSDDKEHPDENVTVTIDIKSTTEFAISYTAGWFSVENEQGTPVAYHIESPIEAVGSYSFRSILYLSVTTPEFPYTKNFAGQLIFETDNTVIRARVPVGADKKSNMTYFEKVVE